MNKEIIFVDSSLQDYQSLIQNVNSAQIVILKENSSAIAQITQALAEQKDVAAVHILSHGSEGSLKLGADILNQNNLENFSSQIKQWGNALTENGDILLYGCDVGAGETGLNFVKHLSEITGADVAASNDLTGSAASGGDGELEVKFGEIETQPLNFASYDYTLAGLTGTADSKSINVTATPTSTAIDVLANDTGTGRLSVNSIVTGPTHGTAIIGDSIYVDGSFTTIGGQPCNSLAKLNSDGTVDTSFNPNMGEYDSVSAIALDSSGNLIVGGGFDTNGGKTRNYIAKLNPSTGAADTTFNPNANSFVDAIAIDSSGNLIVGGNFTSIGGQTRNHIAKLNPTTGAADTTFNPNAGGSVYAIAIDSSGNLIVRGDFYTIGGQTRKYIAKLNPTTGAADTAFNPNASGTYSHSVNAIALDSSGNLIVGGWFTSIGGQTRNHIAKLNPTTGAADTTFNPNASNEVREIALDSSGNLIVGGKFTSIGGQNRNHIAKLNPTTGAADTTFNPNVNGFVGLIAIDSSGNLIVGGHFYTIGGQNRNYIAKLNPTTGAADTTFNPNANGYVDEIAIDPKKNILYTPNANFNGVDTFTYTAKDSSGVSTPITVTVNVNVNHSPVLDNSGIPTLTAINQGDSANSGTPISTIIANLGGTKITDSDTDAKQGIAITGLDTTNGTWQYTTDGTTWNTFTASPINARLLASDANTKIRFVPNASYNGTVNNAFTFKAWDQITGTNGDTADVTADLTANGTSSVFSTANETANITVNPTSTPTTIAINTPSVSNIDRGQPTNLPPNQEVDGNYLLSDEDDTSIPQSAFGKPLFALSGNDNLTGSADNDTIYGNQGADTIDGGDGNDQLFGGKGSDQLSGGNGNDFLSGNNDNDTLTGGDGNDTLRGGKENDVLIGGNGNDELWGDQGFDVLTGGAGNDTFVLQYTATNPSQSDVITDFTSDDKIKLIVEVIGANFSQLTFESVNIILDGGTPIASTAIKSGNDYLGVLYNVNPTALNSSSFLYKLA